MRIETIYEEATERGFCLECLGEVTAGQSVKYAAFGPIHQDWDRGPDGWGDES